MKYESKLMDDVSKSRMDRSSRESRKIKKFLNKGGTGVSAGDDIKDIYDEIKNMRGEEAYNYLYRAYWSERRITKAIANRTWKMYVKANPNTDRADDTPA